MNPYITCTIPISEKLTLSENQFVGVSVKKMLTFFCESGLIIADYLFLLFHTCLILFNVFGWMVKNWRKIHLWTIGLTFMSWFLLGIWYGWGFVSLPTGIGRYSGILGKITCPIPYSQLLVQQVFWAYFLRQPGWISLPVFLAFFGLRSPLGLG